MNKEKIIKIAAGLCLVLAGVLFLLGRNATDDAEGSTSIDFSSAYSSLEESDIAEEDPGGICCYVCGAVANPGVYEFGSGSRINDAITAAGGFTEDADSSYLNLAELVTDGMQIKVPTVAEAQESEASKQAEEDGLVNINTASESELTTLPGIGTARAAAIISYRETSGSFASKEDIMNVPGIKEASYEKIKDYIKVEG